MNQNEHREQFLAFVRPFVERPEDGPARLKVEHSFRVWEHVRLLVEAGSDDPSVRDHADSARASLLAALYHDCGRFPQFRQYGTFVDARSVDHARLGVSVLREQDFLRHESDRVKKLVLTAVLLHNRHRLPPGLDAGSRLIVDRVRDADKLDILRIMVQHLEGALPERDAVFLSVRDDPERWTPQVLNDVMAGRVARYTDLRYINDFRLLLGSWLHDLKFSTTREAVRRSGLMNAVLEGLPRVPQMEEAKTRLLSLLSDPRAAAD